MNDFRAAHDRHLDPPCGRSYPERQCEGPLYEKCPRCRGTGFDPEANPLLVNHYEGLSKMSARSLDKARRDLINHDLRALNVHVLCKKCTGEGEALADGTCDAPVEYGEKCDTCGRVCEIPTEEDCYPERFEP